MKRYKAPSMVEAMKKVRGDFGDDAVILSSEVVYSKGFFGLFKQKSFEVVAGYDKVYDAPSTESVDLPATQKVQPLHSSGSEESIEMKKELLELKRMVQNIQRPVTVDIYPDSIKPILEYLTDAELSDWLVKLIGDELLRVTSAKNIELHPEDQLEISKKVLLQNMKELPFGGTNFEKKYINVVGPTGVGKTTTIAKMAARAMLEQKKKVGFVTTDTYRIAAIEQLKTYANLLQAPVEVAYSAEDFAKAMEKLSHVDLIFIDTAGRNYREEEYVQDLKELIDFNREMESYLVLSMTGKEKDMESIIQQFSTVPIEKFIFTKLDETNSIGSMLNLMIKYNKGLAYYTDGQEVPEDIIEGSFDQLIDRLFKEFSHA
ncbi:flagellar biosynthesis protein FlhF [Chungangia koreensis]|uniref:Flagellar biosynthesis protein FlhF n=1 Tax=Chungangia koreensis TaxID=752657 RepID=A0ABV8X259_9LACT